MTNKPNNAIMDFNQRFKAYAAIADSALEGLLTGEGIQSELAEAMRYSVFAGGKRLRPVLTLAGAELFGDAKRALPIAAALELIHTYSLIHDDLPAMDDDELRRGKPTSHVMFGEAIAILAGDALLNLAYETLLRGAPDEHKSAYYEAAALVAAYAGREGMVGGQAADILAERGHATSEATLLYIHERKTGALIRAAVLGGAIAAGANEDDAAALKAYADNLGVAFQIEDDILDCTSSPAELGKSVGKDASSGKLTFVAVYGIERARDMAGQYTLKAQAALERFGARADFLNDMAAHMLDRKN